MVPGRTVDAMMVDYLKIQEGQLSGRFLGGAVTLTEWQKSRPQRYREYLDMLGLWPLPERAPLQAKVTGKLERANVAIEKLHFQSKPGLYVTGNLYRPKDAEEGKKLPAILYVCGHSGRGRDGNKTAFQDHGLWFASNGYICLIVDTLQLGEVAGKHHGTYNLGRMWWQAAGYTPAGVECWNGMRAIDYLVSRPEVDPERIGVTGISGGGASTVWISAADPRVKVAVPVSGMSDLQSYVSDKVINGHCDCMFMVNTYRWEWTTIAALIAPRPLLFANSDDDSIFPMPGNRRIIERLRQLYAMYEKPELVDDHVSKGGHAYRPDLRLAIFKWFKKHLRNDSGPIQDANFPEIPGHDLRVFPADSDLPTDQINDRIDETFVALARNDKSASGGRQPASGGRQPPVATPDGKWQVELLQALRQKSFRTFGDQLPAARRMFREERDPGIVEQLAIEEGIALEVLTPAKSQEKGETGTLFVRDAEGGKDDDSWIAAYPADGPVRVLSVRPGRPEAVPNYVQRSCALLGLTVDTGRVRDIAATVRYLHDQDSQGRTWRVVGRKQAGILAAYAALFEEAISSVVAIDPPASHRSGPIFLNVLRVCDIPEALGLLAPRSLTLVNARDKAFDRTEQIYKLAGAAARLKRK